MCTPKYLYTSIININSLLIPDIIIFRTGTQARVQGGGPKGPGPPPLEIEKQKKKKKKGHQSKY